MGVWTCIVGGQGRDRARTGPGQGQNQGQGRDRARTGPSQGQDQGQDQARPWTRTRPDQDQARPRTRTRPGLGPGPGRA